MTKTSMKYPKRYSPHYTLRNGDTGLASFGVEAKDDGIYVEHAECWKLYEEVIRLKAQVELLTKVGDELSNKLWMNCDSVSCEETCVAWDDAKRGKNTL